MTLSFYRSFCLLLACLVTTLLCGEIKHHSLTTADRNSSFVVWEELLSPFNELIISWDATRAERGYFLIQVSLLLEEWSPWFDYAYWGVDTQYTFSHNLPEMALKVYQDTIEVTNKKMATGFRVRVVTNENSSLEKFRALHATAIDQGTHHISPTVATKSSVQLDVAGLSQIALAVPNSSRLCSPTSTTAVIRFLSNSMQPSVCGFADAVIDSTFDIFGNWILNTAEGSHLLGPPWHCFVAHLTSLDQIITQLEKGFPVVVSVKGPLENSASSYESGHLLVVKGYDATTESVLCMDPAFPTDELTATCYPWKDFISAWERRKGIAYLFDKKTGDNMLTLYVKHYLTPMGIIYFENTWWGELQSILREQKGFLSITYKKSEEESDCIDITLCFSDEETFDQWASLPAHDELFQALTPYRSRNYMKAVQTMDHKADPAKLVWTTY